MSHNTYDCDNEFKTIQDDWVRVFDLPGVLEQITDSPCGGEGNCGKCRVMVLEGECTPPAAEERVWLNTAELEQGIRLACHCQIRGTIRLRFPHKAAPQILIKTRPEISNLPGKGEVKTGYGMAADIGTTTVVGSIYNLGNGKEMHISSGLNPQSAFGMDVMSRINYASHHEGTKRLQRCILNCLDQITIDNCTGSGIEAADIKEIVITGNTVMLHLLAGVDPSAMGRFPYKPEFITAINKSAVDLGLTVPVHANVLLMPSASAFIGADIVAGIVATGLEQGPDNVFLLDLGTNGEMVLFSNNRLWACSVAIGPALEGMNIECGMRAGAGAVDQVWIEDEKLCMHVIGEGQARGLCGSGLIETVGVLLHAGIAAVNGRISCNNNSFPDWAERIIDTERGRRFWLIPPCNQNKGLYISQNDVRQLQLAKGAVCAGIKLLLDAAGIKAQQVQEIKLAGALGNYLNSDGLIELGFFPREWRGKIRPVGNSALQGAIMALKSTTVRNQAEEISHKIKSLDLTSGSEFQNIFVRSMSFSSTGWTS